MLYELRIYHTVPGRKQELLDRFRDHTIKLFAKHQMKITNFWVDHDDSKDQFYYLVQHQDLKTRDIHYKTFSEDPEWLKVREVTEANGPLFEKIDVIYMHDAPFFQPQ